MDQSKFSSTVMIVVSPACATARSRMREEEDEEPNDQ